MDLRIKPKADLGSWRALGCRLILCLFSSVALLFVWDFVIAFVITVAFRAREPCVQWDPVTFQEWKVPYEMAVLILVLPPSIEFLIARMYVYANTPCGLHRFLIVSFTSLPSSRLTTFHLAFLTYPPFLFKTSKCNLQ